MASFRAYLLSNHFKDLKWNMPKFGAQRKMIEYDLFIVSFLRCILIASFHTQKKRWVQHGFTGFRTNQQKMGTMQNVTKDTMVSLSKYYPTIMMYILEIKPCGLGSRIRDVEAFR